MDPLQTQIYQAIHILEIAKQFQGRTYELDLKKIAKALLEESVKGIVPDVQSDPVTTARSISGNSLEGMPQLEETIPHPYEPPLAHSPIQLTSQPVWQPVEEEDQTTTNTTNRANKNDFTRWCKTLGLESGHQFFFIKGGQEVQTFHLGYGRDGTPFLHTTLPDGNILKGKSPGGILKAYLEKKANKKVSVGDAWGRLSMQSPNGLTKWPISERLWLNYEWNSQSKHFDPIV